MHISAESISFRNNHDEIITTIRVLILLNFHEKFSQSYDSFNVNKAPSENLPISPSY